MLKKNTAAGTGSSRAATPRRHPRKNLFLFGQEGELRAVVGDARSDPGSHVGRYGILASTPELLVLRRQPEDGQEEAGRVLMAGEIVGRSTILEVISVISSSRWAGTLHVFGESSIRSLGFNRGVLRHASSDHPDDRLDKVLYRIGVLSPSQAEALYREAGPDERFGQVLVAQGLANREQLFRYLERQMEQILLEAVLVERGGYLFLVADEAEPVPAATAHIPLEKLLFTAAERLDRMAEFRRVLPDDQLRPILTAKLDLARLSSRARLVAGHSDGERTVREISGETRLGRFETLAALFELIRTEAVDLRPPRQSAGEVAAELVAPFNLSLEEIYGSLDGAGVAATRQEVRRWVENGDHGDRLAGVLDSGGLVRSDPLAARLCGVDRRRQADELEGALHELVGFALVAASTRLPRDEERDLARRVHRHLRGSAA